MKVSNKQIKKLVVVIAGVLVVVTLTAGAAGTAVGYGNNIFNNESVIELNINTPEYKKGSLTVALSDENANYIDTGHIKVKANKSGEVWMDAKDINSSSEGKVLCQYVIKWHTYNSNQGTQDKNRRIQDLGVKVLTDTENEFIIPIPENTNVDNSELGIKIYIALQEIDGNGYKSYDEINIKVGQSTKPDTLQTHGKIYGDDGSGYISIEDYIKYAKQIEPLTPEEQDYRDYEIKKYTAPNSLIDLESDEIVISKAAELREASESDEEYIDKVYKLISSMEYDYELFNENKDGRFYLPEIDSKFIEGKGICTNKSWIIATMLRSQGIPTKIVDGYQEFIGAHSWNEVLINGQWVHIDATNGQGFYGNIVGYEPLRVS